jgi:hypothetical protein
MWTVSSFISPIDPMGASTFTVAEVGTFTYQALITDRDACLENCRKAFGGSEEDFDELKLKMNSFINEITEAYIGGRDG